VRGGRAGWQDESPAQPGESSFAGSDYGASLDQLQQVDLLRLHERGFRGAGIIIGVLDTGFHRAHEAFHGIEHPLQVLGEWDFINNDPDTGWAEGENPSQHRHGTWILGCMAAYQPGTLVGAAYEAQYVLAKTEDVSSETPIEEDNYVAGLEFIEKLGGDLATSSLGYIDWYTQLDLDGSVAVTTVAVNMATANGVVCLTAAGNQGHDSDPATSSLLAPSDAFQVIACGAVNSSGAIAGFSSDGPTADGRIKPELCARGVATQTVHADNATGVSGVSGTSLSTPVLAGAVACVVQARPELSVNAIRVALFATASRSDAQGVHPDPLFVEGYGIARAFDAASSGRKAADLNLDGNVDGVDLGMLLGVWNTPAPTMGDLDGDGMVNGADLGLLLGAWGTTNSTC
jgi:subtilisin family serine protease